MKMAPKMESKYGPREPIFQKTCKNGKVCLDCAGVYGLHMSPSREALRATHKPNKNRVYFRCGFLREQIRTYVKKLSQHVSKKVRVFRG